MAIENVTMVTENVYMAIENVAMVTGNVHKTRGCR